MQETFFPTKIIILAELSIKDKEKYFNLLLQNDVKFRKDSEDRYIGNIRILGANIKKSDVIFKKRDLNNYAKTFQERLKKLKEQGFIFVNIIGNNDFEYSSYPRFTSLISFNGDNVRPKSRSLSWVMKIVEDIYDFRFSHEKTEVEREEDTTNFDFMLIIIDRF